MACDPKLVPFQFCLLWHWAGPPTPCISTGPDLRHERPSMPQAGKEDRSRLIPLDSIEMRANCETERRTDLFPLAANNFSNIEGLTRPGLPLPRCDWQKYRWLCSWTARKPISLASPRKISALRGNNGLDAFVFSMHGCSMALNGRYKYPKPLGPSGCVSLRPRFSHHRAPQGRTHHVHGT
jgi:hypothetical protein